jgi:hypothetical protein
MQALYTDGTPVQEGDRVRYHQCPGGLLPPESNPDGTIKWHIGTAAKYPPYVERREELQTFNAKQGYLALDPDELHCKYDVRSGWGGEYGHMAPHIIERLAER